LPPSRRRSCSLACSATSNRLSSRPSPSREATIDKAGQLDAEIVGEFSDPGKSAYLDLHKRTGFLTMLDELKQRNEHDVTRMDYVIVWSLSR
jgi:DNA invertase Pin-like site-specific DNA recombinase